MSRCLPHALLLALISVAPAFSQTPPFRVGDYVRIATGDSASGGLWREGRLLTVSRVGVLMRPAGSLTDTVPVVFDRSVRIQVLRPQEGWPMLGLAVGSAAGTLLGAVAFRPIFEDAWSPGAIAATGALFGGMAGAGAGFVVRPDRWQEIGIPAGGFRITPLTRPPPAKYVAFGKTERWRAFEATEANFVEFFTAWKDSLHPVEGAWEIDGAQSRMSQPWPREVKLPRRVAIIRDQRYEGYDYIAVELPPRSGGFRPGYYAQVRFVLRRLDEPGFFDIRFVPRGGRGRVFKVELFEDWWLEFQFTGSSDILVWDKLGIRTQ